MQYLFSSRNPLFIKSEFSHSARAGCGQGCPGESVAILYSSSQNSLILSVETEKDIIPSKVAILYSSSRNSLLELSSYEEVELVSPSQSFIHQVRILSHRGHMSVGHSYAPWTVAILYSSSQNSLMRIQNTEGSHHWMSQSFIHQVRILSVPP